MTSLQYHPFKSFCDASFFKELSDKKLNELRLDEKSIPITGFYNAPIAADREPALNVSGTSFHASRAEAEAKASSPVSMISPGMLTNVNTLVAFKELDKTQLIRDAGNAIVTAISSRSALDDPSQLTTFLIASFAELKKFKFYYWFAFPVLPLPCQGTIKELTTTTTSGDDHLDLIRAIDNWRSNTSLNQWGFFLIRRNQAGADKTWEIASLSQHEQFWGDTPPMVGFVDPSSILNVPGWPLRNFLVLLHYCLGLDSVSVLCYRDYAHVKAHKSFWIDVSIRAPTTTQLADLVPKTTGWERNSSGKAAPKVSDLGTLINPIQLASQAVDLNLKLMKWRVAPRLNLDVIQKQKCLLLGAGTLGSYIARALLGWGIKKITLVDNGRVSFSNPVRQPLYTFDDCLDGGALKAQQAAAALKKIYPSVDATGYDLEIPMAGHAVTNEAKQHDDYDKLIDLIQSHDVIFLLMDSRESRWLPTVICSALGKLVINVALGFDTYVVMRHGISPDKVNHCPHLGCYFCNDVVAPLDSTTGQSLDQMCTVTRPGISMMASASAVELLASLLQSELQGLAPAYVQENAHENEHESEGPLSVLPHQLRGFLHEFNTMKIWGPSYPNCSACSPPIVEAWRKDGWEFVKQALNQPEIVNEISGLAEIQRKAELIDLELDAGGSESDWFD